MTLSFDENDTVDGQALIRRADAAFRSGDRNACIALIERAYAAFSTWQGETVEVAGLSPFRRDELLARSAAVIVSACALLAPVVADAGPSPRPTVATNH